MVRACSAGRFHTRDKMQENPPSCISITILRGTIPLCCRFGNKRLETRNISMNNVIYLVGLVVVVGAILSLVFN